MVFARRGWHVCLHNLGGNSNVTSLDWRRGSLPRPASFDTGPANLLCDRAVRQMTQGKKACDFGGAWARRGRVSEPLLVRWLQHPYFLQPPPKSKGRELFGEVFWKAEQGRMRRAKLTCFDVLATLTEFTARSVALNYETRLGAHPDLVVLGGGGAKNPILVERLTVALQRANPRVRVVPTEEFGCPVKAIEPAAFALLAFFRWRNRLANFPATTGSRRAVCLGQLTGPG